MNSLISEVYSDALFNLAEGNSSLDSKKEDLVFVKKTLDENEEVKRLLQNPRIKKEEKKDMLDKLFSGMDKHSMNFVKILIDKSRFFYFDEIVDNFIDKYNEKNSIVNGTLTSARQMEAEDVEKIKQALSKRFGKKVELEYEINPELIGGFSVKLAGKMIDNTLLGRLSAMKSSLKERGEL